MRGLTMRPADRSARFDRKFDDDWIVVRSDIRSGPSTVNDDPWRDQPVIDWHPEMRKPSRPAGLQAESPPAIP